MSPNLLLREKLKSNHHFFLLESLFAFKDKNEDETFSVLIKNFARVLKLCPILILRCLILKSIFSKESYGLSNWKNVGIRK